MQELYNALKKNPIVYVTRDLERAFGLVNTAGYHIITNSSEFAKEAAKRNKNILLIIARARHALPLLSTQELLEHPDTKKYLKQLSKINKPRILVFKNTSLIERICEKNNWTLLNPPAVLANQVEEKISQVEWLGPLEKYLPPHKIMLCKDLPATSTVNNPAPKEYIIQFNRAHTGGGTMLIVSEKPLNELRKKFPNREVRVTEYISGPAYTVNACVSDKQVLIGNPSYQITGLQPFTDSPFATIGNDWALPVKMMSHKQAQEFKKIVTDVGKRLAKNGWRGLFGVDVIADEKTGKIYLIEINARQPASTTFESQLQQIVISNPAKRGEKSSSLTTRFLVAPSGLARNDNVTIFEAHLAALLNLPPTTYHLQPIKNGAQIIQRVLTTSLRGVKRRSNLSLNKQIKQLQKSGFNVIKYANAKPGEDLLRIQSLSGIMARPEKFNARGQKIIQALKTV